ncbi:hypothetical protein ACSFCW_16825 [Yokenella regensburgei]|uniref:hypothetical protein n=1 Tax=Yokenella regensburgei TaxID=158877 RepID=UPI003EDA87FF
MTGFNKILNQTGIIFLFWLSVAIAILYFIVEVRIGGGVSINDILMLIAKIVSLRIFFEFINLILRIVAALEKK